MKTLYKIFFVTLMLMIVSCGNTENKKPSRKMRIPDDRLAAILTDTYLTAGIMDLFAMRDTWAQRDSIQNYIDVIESHGYTYEQFETTMRYYFMSKPRKLSRIYDRVTGNLLELETELMTQQSAVKPSEKNLWPGKPDYRLPEEFTRDPVWFDIPVDKPGEYILKADIRVFEDDKSLNPRVTVYFSYRDSAGEEKRDYWQEVFLVKDGQIHNIQIKHTLDTIPDARLRGWLLNHDNQSGKWEKHARISNIRIVHADDFAAQ
ncbi:MAG TPA: DUF4296 domain-containing protein [Bacteroidales bacterium]|nr:DUF4296 domain-containing protein [Bacteroidales bacterium]HOH15261.1 DUF4296 domain-containing protein [Bacteroidales bacterium]